MPNRIVKVILRGDIGGLVGSMAAASKSVTDTARNITDASKESKKFRGDLTALGDTAGKVGLTAAGGLGLVSKAAMDWESAWAGVTKTVDGTPAQLAKVEAGLRDLATTLPATHGEIAAVAEAAGQLGVATEDIVSFTRTMVDLGETTNLTADEAATSIAQMANVMGTSGDEVDNLGSVLVALGNDGASTEKQIIEMAQGISGAAAIVGASESDVLAIANAVASMGIEVEAGGTAVSRVLTDMAKATAQGSDELEIFASTAGMSATEFAAAFEARPAEALAAFTAGLDRVRNTGGDVFTILDDLSLSDVRVSRALLGMAASGDLLTDSLELGSKAWAENTALAAEAEKRYDTTASKGRVAFNEIKDAAIDFGDEALPVVASAADVLGDLAGAFGDLPGPVKEATTGLLAVTAVTGGALWFGAKVIGGIANTREQLTGLGVDATKTGRIMRSALAVGVVLEGFNLLDQAMDALFDKNLNESNLSRSLDALARGTVTGEIKDKFGKDLADFGLQADLATSKVSGLSRTLRKVPAVGGFLSGDFLRHDTSSAIENIEKLDQALASMVESGQSAEAAAVFEQFAAAAEEAGVDSSDLTRLFGEYGVAVENAKDVTEDSIAPTEGLAGAQAALGDSAAAGAEAQRASAEALKESREAARDTAKQFAGLGDSLDDADVSFNDWLKSLEDQAAALRDFTSNARKAAKNGLRDGLIKELEAAGPAGALRMKQLADASETEIRRANRAWRLQQQAIRDYVNLVGGVPPRVATDLDLTGEPAAAAALRRIKALAEDVAGTYRIDFVVNQLNAVNRPKVPSMDRGADGATVPKTGLPYADRHLYLLADGEEIISNRYGQADQYRADRDAGRIPRYGDGGTAGASGLSTYSRTGTDRLPSFADGGTTITTPGHVVALPAGAPAGQVIDYDRLAAAVSGNRLLAHRDSRDALLWAMRTALRETPMLRSSPDLSLLGAG